MKIIAIGGAPGCGKSTLMKKVMTGDWSFHKDVKLVPYHKQGNKIVLGKYEEGEVFGGTDKMSMAVQPEVIKFLQTLPDDSIVLFEGDRLFNMSFLEHCSQYDLKIIILQTSSDERARRYAERNSSQNETWIQGRISKVNNILRNLSLMEYIETFKNETIDDQRVVLEYIDKEIRGIS